MRESPGILHPGEVARLLYILRRLNRESVSIRDIIELANQTAGLGYRYPDPITAIRFALEIGLLAKTGQVLTLTKRGEVFSQQFSLSPIDLSIAQGILILGILLDDRQFRGQVRHLLSKFHKSGPGSRLQTPTDSIGGTAEQDLSIFLQQLGALEYRSGAFLISPEFEAVFPLEIIVTAKLDEEELWRRLEAQRLRGRVAEEFVLEYERDRLTKLGRGDLAELVQRISAVDVSAGYDINSFEADGSPRYIEVKSSVGSKVRFEWSLAERTTAAQLDKLYWVYFLPLAQTLPALLEPITLIRNPVAEIASGHLVESPSSFLVEAVS